MFTARKKIVKEKGAEPDEFEETVAQVCHSCWQASMAGLQQQRARQHQPGHPRSWWLLLPSSTRSQGHP